MTDWLIPFLCGLGASVLSAWGVGGGTLLLLVMTLLLDVDQRTAQGINLLFFLPAAASALFVHRKNGYLDRPTLHAAIPPAAAAPPLRRVPAALRRQSPVARKGKKSVTCDPGHAFCVQDSPSAACRINVTSSSSPSR